LTAGHCAGGDSPYFITFDPQGGTSADVSSLVPGMSHQHPNFCIGCGQGVRGFDRDDLAVVVLDKAIHLERYAQLPERGVVDTLPMKTHLTIVGYGIQDRLKKVDEGEFDARWLASAALVQNDDVIHETFLHVSANPAQGKGAECFGDSGGPVLLD